ncbi:MAG: fatty acid desaturase [Rhodospirillaceae bacterium]|jgi:fatty acid desaturase|nr:fatty acid desaturase [Rhodospirillaceae bacterium]MBT3495319.1 fatty acid desaturase [Rhodospirillaceae bacterium]MBT3781962.1 fatty acid desaturase [Rhodospirillaceae bacterium]MBT3979620.1 fatty acid desaturase [Rhodospirillaceae bacterium]MBT4166820.1 fatty acid desaturase [Rhodospirillaceae bacterium]
MQIQTAEFEGPTWALIVAVYGGWIGATWYGAALPWWLLLLAGGWFTGWYYSLQHEVIHGHPTAWPRFNDLIGYAPLGLFIPYDVYRADHMRHHTKENLTIPGVDPESYYFDTRTWDEMASPLKVMNIINNALIGRLTVGVGITILLFWWREGRRLVRGDLSHLGAWIRHAVLVAAVLYWVAIVCGLPIWLYVLTFAYPGLALTMMRSYCEHLAADNPDHRTAIVESPTPLGLLYLNNNLHIAHHDQPGMPWYKLPAYYQKKKADFLSENNDLIFQGYSGVIRQYLFAPIDTPVLPEQ